MQLLRRTGWLRPAVAGALLLASVAAACSDEREEAHPATFRATDGVSVSSRFDPETDYVLALGVQAGELLVIDPSRGDVDATIATGSSPMVVERPSTNQILVSGFETEDGASRPVLHRYDLTDDGPRLGATWELPNRNSYPVFANNIALSGDERFLFYAEAGGVRQDVPGCASGEVHDGPTCRDWWLVAMDLDDEGASAEHVRIQLKRSCGYARLSLGPGDTAVVSCSGETWVVHADGRVERVIETGGMTAGFARGDGTLVSVHQDAAILHRERGAERRISPLAAGEELMWLQIQLSGDRDELFIGYRREGTFINGLHGVARIDLRTMRPRPAIELDEAVSVAPRGERGLAVLQSDGTIEILDRYGHGKVVPISLWEVPEVADDTWNPPEWALLPS